MKTKKGNKRDKVVKKGNVVNQQVIKKDNIVNLQSNKERQHVVLNLRESAL